MYFSDEDRDFEASALVEGAIEIMVDLEPDFPVAWVRHQLQKMAKDVEAALMSETNPHLRLEGLLRLFYASGGSVVIAISTMRLKMPIWTR